MVQFITQFFPTDRGSSSADRSSCAHLFPERITGVHYSFPTRVSWLLLAVICKGVPFRHEHFSVVNFHHAAQQGTVQYRKGEALFFSSKQELLNSSVPEGVTDHSSSQVSAGTCYDIQ